MMHTYEQHKSNTNEHDYYKRIKHRKTDDHDQSQRIQYN